MNPSPSSRDDTRDVPREACHELMLTTADAHAVTATAFPSDGPAKARLLIAGATGVPQRFYRRFAQHAASRGFDALTLDFRGIGRSAPASLRAYSANFIDWARQDLASAIEAWRVPSLPLVLVGHSFGGHALALLPHERLQHVAAVYGLAVGAGWHGWMPVPERWRVRAMWTLAAPVLTRTVGYLPWSHLRMGEDLPLGVYRQWRRWCGFPHYFFDDPLMADQLPGAEHARMPMVMANAFDDAWALPRSRDAFMRGFRQAPWTARDLDPAQYGLRSIGHMGYFRVDCQPLWDEILAWFDQAVAP